MASEEHRKFFYDWNEGKYKLSDERNHLYMKQMNWKHYHQDVRINKDEIDNRNIAPSVDVFLKNQNENKAVSNAGQGGVNSVNKAKESQTLDEISKGHKVMTSVLSTRLLRLTAAKTLWHKVGAIEQSGAQVTSQANIASVGSAFKGMQKDMNSFIEYILRLDDDAVVVDILPILTKRVRDDGPELSTLSMGACLDLLPVLGQLLDSKYEDYIVVAIDMIREIMKRWWKQLQTTGKNEKQKVESDFRCSRSVNGVYMLLISMADRIQVLAKRTGTIGEKAKVLQELMALL